MKGVVRAWLLLSLATWSHGLVPQPCCEGDGVLDQDTRCPNVTSKVRLAGCREGHFLLDDVVLTEGGLSTQDTPGYVFATDPDKFCMGRMKNPKNPADGPTVQVAVVCFQAAETRDIDIYGVLTLVSVVFLALTIAVYLYLPELRDLQGKCTLSLCVCLALGYMNLGLMQLGYSYQKDTCSLHGFITYFWMMATFFWMNVVSINIYRSVNDTIGMRKTESRQFILYNAYAWGCTVLFLTVTLVTNYVEGDHIQPGFGVLSCWFKGAKETWTYFYGPLAILITANITLFVITSIKLWINNKNYEVSTLKRLRYKFQMYAKLFVFMGISWVFEIASFAHAQYHIVWRIADVFNCLQGVVFFVLLVVLRRRALRGLAARGACGERGRRLAQRLQRGDVEEDSIVGAEEGDVDADGDAPYSVDLDADPALRSLARGPTSELPNAR